MCLNVVCVCVYVCIVVMSERIGLVFRLGTSSSKIIFIGRTHSAANDYLVYSASVPVSTQLHERDTTC